jgi:AsmA protein
LRTFRKAKRIVRAILFSALAIALIALGLVFVAPHFISTAEVRERALAQVEKATGYRFRIDGSVKISVFPSLDLVARDVGIARPDNDGSAEFAKVAALRFGLVLRSLLAGKVQFTEITLVNPIVKFPLPENAASRSMEAAGEGTAKQQQLSIKKLIIHNGTVILPEREGQPGKQITALNAEAALPTANGPLSFNGAALYDGDAISTQGTIGSFAHFIDGGPVPAKLELYTPDLPEGAFLTGTASYKDDDFRLAQFRARSGSHKVSGTATYSDDTLTVTQGIFDDVPFSGAARLVHDTLTIESEVSAEGKPVRLSASIDKFDWFLAGGEAPIKLNVMAPDYLADEIGLNGAIANKDDAIAFPTLTALSGENVVSGALHYKDGILKLSQVSATLGNRTIAGDVIYQNDVVTTDITVDIDGQPASVRGSITGIEKLIDGGFAPIKLEVVSPDHLSDKAVVSGDARYKDGVLALNAFTVLSGDYTITGNAVYEKDVLVLESLKAQTSDQTVSGTLKVNLAGEVPAIAGTLVATGALKSKGGGAPTPTAQEAAEPKLIATPAEVSPNPRAPSAPGGVEVAVAPPPTREAPSGEKVSAAESLKAVPKAGGAGWRADKSGLSALREFNADLIVTFDQFVFEDIQIEAATVKLKLSEGKLTAETKDLRAYGGGGTMTLELTSGGAHRLNLAVSGLDALAFLRDVAEFQTIEGEAAIALNLTASGKSERAAISSLAGTAKFEFTNGALLGLSVANMLRNLTTGILTGWQYTQDTKTVFTKFSANFDIAKGQAQTDDLRLNGPLVSVGGAGTVDIPAQRLKFRVNPLMLASIEDQSGKSNMLGFPVPIAVSGPWDRPSFYPDIVGVLDNPVAAYQQLNKLGGGLITMPANMLGVDTGDGGLVEKSIAIPGAVTKGVVGGIGQILGVKKREEPKAPVPAAADRPDDKATKASRAPLQVPNGEAGQKKKPASNPPANRGIESFFDQ